MICCPCGVFPDSKTVCQYSGLCLPPKTVCESSLLTQTGILVRFVMKFSMLSHRGSGTLPRRKRCGTRLRIRAANGMGLISCISERHCTQGHRRAADGEYDTDT